MKHDARGIPVSSGSAEAIALYETAIGQLHSYVGDPIATIDRALVASPEFVAGHAFKALALATFASASSRPRSPTRSRWRGATARRPTRASAA
jgi:hypothetical protein